jgi:branched-chain amino acid transport system substrate-binding protein
VRIRKPVTWPALLLALALAASACGSDSGSSADGTLLNADAKGAVDSALANTTTTAAGATTTAAASAKITSIKDYEALWATQREAIVKEIKDGGYGWDKTANKVTGPGGFSVDLSTCPAGWDPYEGLVDGKILIGQTMAQSGTLADYGNIGTSQKIYYDYINAQGGIKDSEGKTYTITADQRDDAYDAAKTVPLVDELLDSEKVFALQTLGSPNTMKVYDKINQRCVPDPFVMSGHPAWGDPVNHPWIWGHQLAYNTEAILWGGLLEDKFKGKDEITVAALIMQNDFGKAYDLGFSEVVKTSKLKINYVFERIEPTAPTITNQMTTLAAKKPDVFIAMTAGTSCAQAITEAANNGMKESVTMLFMPSVCKGLNFVGKDAQGDDGTSSNGWWIVGGGGKDFNDKKYADDPWVSFARDLLVKANHPSEDSSQLGNGFAFAWPVVEALKIAAELPGGISRPNLMLAARSMDMTNPNLQEGIKYNMSGKDDPYPTEGSEFAVFDGAGQTWVTQADLGIIELSGKSSPCAWDQASSTCK